MCGIVGKLAFDSDRKISRQEIEAMLFPIIHRGPDGNGIYLDEGVGLGHCRLSIIDVGGGNQPMANEDETIWIIFNGEIYNFKTLRAALIDLGHKFKSLSDTEVIIHLYEEYGIECLARLQGMFAFAIWDGRQRRLLLARDRVGIKPLYYCVTDGVLLFASELKAILTHPALERSVDLVAMREAFTFHYTPGERTLLNGIKKLLPGHYVTARFGNYAIEKYWDLGFSGSRHRQSFADSVEELYVLLSGTVRDHMIADVPVGILLSGGVDSSAILSLAVRETGKTIKSFTLGFAGDQVVDERPFAKLASKSLCTEHFEMTISATDFWSALPKYVAHMEEVVCEPPAIALYYIASLAKEHVKVLLSGEGGDEAFGGYPNYPHILKLEKIRKALGPFAGPIGHLAEKAACYFGSERVERYGFALGHNIQEYYLSRSSSPTALFNKSAGLLFSESLFEATKTTDDIVSTLLDCLGGASNLNRMLYIDSKTWLPDDLLLKADKMTMANSIELRVPLLDHKVLEFAASLPDGHKVEANETKRVLKAAFSRILPSSILNRKKAGFPVPYSGWMRGPLSAGIQDVLLSTRASGRGYYNRKCLEKLIKRNSDSGGYAKEIFLLLTNEMWHREFVDLT